MPLLDAQSAEDRPMVGQFLGRRVQSVPPFTILRL